jgi:hypothetical protein
MYNNHRLNTESALQILDSIIENLQADLKGYISKPNHSERFKLFKENQIRQLKAVSDQFKEFLEFSTIEILEQYNKTAEQKELRYKMEGCLLLHGVPYFEIQQFLNKKLSNIENMVEWAYMTETAEIPGEGTIITKPQVFRVPLLVQLMHKGRTGLEPQKEIKKTDKPVIPFSLLKEKAKTGSCSDKNFIVKLLK